MSSDSFIVRPTPRAAVVALPSVPTLIAFLPEKRAQQGGPERDRRLELGLRGLLLLALDGGLGAAQPLGQRRLLRRVLLAHRVDRLVAGRAIGVLQTDPEVALALARLRRQLRIAVAE